MSAQICECSDPGCPVHFGETGCQRLAEYVVHRLDGDYNGTAMCQPCAQDAMYGHSAAGVSATVAEDTE